MAEVVNEMPAGKNGQSGKYNKFLDGRVWKLVDGEDFQSGHWIHFQNSVLAAAHYKKMKLIARTADGFHYVQAYTPAEQAKD
jgi:hypothetical protein